jgi:ABC-type glycerol-3-phosphate transport system permease component
MFGHYILHLLLKERKMNDTKARAVSGCVIWFLLICIISGCVMPVFFIVGSVSSFSDFAIKTTGGWLCPEGTTPESYSYSTTTHDENGFEQPATAYELHCVDASADVVKKDPVGYSFLWIGIFAGIGLLLSAILSFVFAVPGGMLVTKILNKLRISRANVGTGS